MISGHGEILVDVQDDDEVKHLKQYRSKIKSEANQRLVEKFSISIDYFVRDYREMEELENNAKAQDVKDKDLMLFSYGALIFPIQKTISFRPTITSS